MTNGSSSATSKEARPQGLGSKELYYVLRRLGPCACRDPTLFVDCFADCVRLCNLPPKPEAYQPNSRVSQVVLKVAGPAKNSPLPLNTVQRGLLNLLVDFLCADSFEDTAGKEEAGDVGKGEEDLAEKVVRPLFMIRSVGMGAQVVGGGGGGGSDRGQIGRSRQGSYRRQARGNLHDEEEDMASEEMNMDAVEVTPSEGGHDIQSGGSGGVSVGGEKVPEKRPLLSKAAVLRLLAELVDSYPSCAKMVTESSREIKIDGQQAKVREGRGGGGWSKGGGGNIGLIVLLYSKVRGVCRGGSSWSWCPPPPPCLPCNLYKQMNRYICILHPVWCVQAAPYIRELTVLGMGAIATLNLIGSCCGMGVILP